MCRLRGSRLGLGSALPSSGEWPVNQDEASLSLLANGAWSRARLCHHHGIERTSGHMLLLLHSPVVMVQWSDFRRGWEGEVGGDRSDNVARKDSLSTHL